MKLVQSLRICAPNHIRSSRQSRGCIKVGPVLSMLTLLVLLLVTAPAHGRKSAHNSNGLPPQTLATENRKNIEPRQETRASGFGQKPRSGWLYVLDRSEELSESRVLLVDPERGRVVGDIKPGNDLDAALSPDGNELYVGFTRYNKEGKGRKDYLGVINTRSGALVSTVNDVDRWISTGPQYAPSMAFSRDGRSLYLLKHRQEGNTDTYYVLTFDTIAKQFLPGKAMVPDCVAGSLVPWSSREGLTVICFGTSDLRFLRLSENGEVLRLARSNAVSDRLSLWSKGVAEYGRRAGPGFLSTDGRSFTVLMGDGRVFKIDNETRAITHTDAIDRESRGINISPQASSSTPERPSVDDWLAGKWIRYQSSEFSADGRRMYLGVGWLAHLNQGVQEFTELAILDSHTLSRLGTIKTSHAFAGFAASKDDRRLYAISPEQACVMVIDIDSRREVRTIYGVGNSPFRVIVAP